MLLIGIVSKRNSHIAHVFLCPFERILGDSKFAQRICAGMIIPIQRCEYYRLIIHVIFLTTNCWCASEDHRLLRNQPPWKLGGGYFFLCQLDAYCVCPRLIYCIAGSQGWHQVMNRPVTSTCLTVLLKFACVPNQMQCNLICTCVYFTCNQDYTVGIANITWAALYIMCAANRL
jgi:hypothetical protein